MKNVKGGYKIISLEENDLTASFSVKGIYTALSKTYDKTILVSGIVIDGEKKNDAYTEVNVDSTDYKFTVYGYEVTVSSDDSVEAEPKVDGVSSIGGVSGAITLGEGLSITEEGELSASGGGGSTLYLHSIKINGSGANVSGSVSLIYVSSSNEQINTAEKLHTAIGNNTTYSANGYVKSATVTGTIISISISGDSHTINFYYVTDTGTSNYGSNLSYLGISDHVMQIS